MIYVLFGKQFQLDKDQIKANKWLMSVCKNNTIDDCKADSWRIKGENGGWINTKVMVSYGKLEKELLVYDLV